MLRNRLILYLFLFLLWNTLSGEKTPNELIVKTQEARNVNRQGLGLSDLDNFLTNLGIEDISVLNSQESGRFFIVSCSEEINWEEMENLDFEGVEYIQPNYLNSFYFIPNDPLFFEQDMDIINAISAWDIFTGSSNIIVGVVDSGLHFDHEDLQDNIYINNGEIPIEYFNTIDSDDNNRISNQELINYFIENNLDINSDGEINHQDIVWEGSFINNGIDEDDNGYIDDIMGWDFTDAPALSNIASGDYLLQDNYPEDELNHGTHIAGIIGATSNNSMGITGLCHEVNLLNIRAGFRTADGLSGILQDDDAAAGIIYAVDMGADVINLSWGDYINSPIIADACSYAYERGSVVVVSAGNTGEYGLMYPANLSYTIAVGAVNSQRERYSQSSYGEHLDIVAPGVSVISCYDVNTPYYEYMTGTSISSPYVAGAIALLLGREPDLNAAQVKSRLVSSANDLGEVGFDYYYGYGLLDVENLLNDGQKYLVEISSPEESQGLSSDTALYGTITAIDFKKYCLMYCEVSAVEAGEWMSVEAPHSMSPEWQYEEVIEGELAYFNLPAHDGEYVLRAELVTAGDDHYYYPVNIFVDKTEPHIIEGEIGLQYRLENGVLRSFFKIKYDDAVEIEVLFSSESGSQFQLSTSSRDSMHYIEIPLSVEEGLYDAEIYAENVSGLQNSYFTQELDIRKEYIDYSTWKEDVCGGDLYCLSGAFSAGEDGLVNDFIGMQFSEEGRVISFWETNSNSIINTCEIDGFAELFWPLSWGNQEGMSLEVAGIEANKIALYQVNGGISEKLFEVNSSYGASFIDCDQDGVDELAVIYNSTNGGITERVIGVFRKNLTSWELIGELHNGTETYSRNEFTSRVECNDYDGDGKQELFTADNDGDIIIYEYDPLSDNIMPEWSSRLQYMNIDHIVSGNLMGDEKPEFCAVGWSYSEKKAENSLRYIGIFGYSETDENYFEKASLIINGHDETFAVECADLDNDGYDELILAGEIIYIVECNSAAEASYVWFGEAGLHYSNSICAIASGVGEYGKIISCKEEDGEYWSVIYSPADVFTGPGSVSGLCAEAIDKSTVGLNWEAESTAETYRIFRKEAGQDDIFEVFIGETDGLEFFDGDLEEDVALAYRIRAFNSEYNPSVGLPSYWVFSEPSAVPELISLDMVSLREIKIAFDVMMAEGSIITNHYEVNNGIGSPESVNFIDQKRGMLLSFADDIPQADDYTLDIREIRSDKGVAFDDGCYGFIWQNDTIAPEIVSCEVSGDSEIIVTFSEEIDKESAELISNYFLELPEVDKENYINGVSAEEACVELHFASDVCVSNELYYLRVINIEDLYGNRINGLGNKTSFGLTNRSLKNLITYPNPFYTEKYSEFRFAGLPSGKKGELRIYDLAGELVYQSAISERTALENFFSWPGTNSSGKRVSSGLYFYMLQIGAELQKGKIAVVN